MDAAAIVAALNAALELSGSLLPLVDQLKNSGKITVEQQDALLAQYNSLKAKADGQFSGPQWQVSGR